MQDQFVVPQFLDVESKIIGPITGRQFVILLVTILLDALVYRIFLSIVPVLLFAIPITLLGVIFAFAKVNGQPFHYILLNMIQTLRKPMVRVWDKRVTDAEIRERLREPEKEEVEMIPTKPRMETSKLSELSLIVNTGGAYQPETDVLVKPYDK